MRGWRVKLLKDKMDSKKRVQAKAGKTGTIISREVDSENKVSVQIDGRYYPLHDVPFEFLERINDKAHEIPAGGWR